MTPAGCRQTHLLNDYQQYWNFNFLQIPLYVAHLIVLLISEILLAYQCMGYRFTWDKNALKLMNTELIQEQLNSIVTWDELTIRYTCVPGIALNLTVILVCSWTLAFIVRRRWYVKWNYTNWCLFSFVRSIYCFFNNILLCFNWTTCLTFLIIPFYCRKYREPELAVALDVLNEHFRKSFWILLLFTTCHTVITIGLLPTSWSASRRTADKIFLENPSVAHVQLDTGTCRIYPMRIWCSDESCSTCDEKYQDMDLIYEHNFGPSLG